MRKLGEMEIQDFFYYYYLMVIQNFQSLSCSLWERIDFHRQNYSFPMKNRNFGKDMFCREHKGFFREGLQTTSALVFCLCTHHKLQSYRLFLGIRCCWGMWRLSKHQSSSPYGPLWVSESSFTPIAFSSTCSSSSTLISEPLSLFSKSKWT